MTITAANSAMPQFDGPPVAPEGAFTIDEFCRAFRLSRSMFYKLRSQGLGPKVMAAGKPLVSYAAAAEWRRAREAAAMAEVA
jgi:hypothetical protein